MSRWHKFDHPDLPTKAFQPRGWKGAMTFEGGGGGGSPPPPDPKVAEVQQQLADLSKEQWNMFKTEIYPNLTRLTQAQEARAQEAFNTTQEVSKYQLNQAKEMYDLFKTTSLPALKKLQADADLYNEAGYREQLASSARADIDSAFENQRLGMKMRRQTYGIDPTSGVDAGAERAMDVQQALAGARASNQVRQAATDLGIAKQANIYALSSGLSGMGNTATGLGLSATSQGLGFGQTALGNYSGIGQNITTSAGGAGNALAQSGSIGNQQYASQISAWNAQQQAAAMEAAGWGQAIGSSIGAYAAFK